MTKISLLGGASILAVGLIFGTSAFADQWTVNNNQAAAFNGATGNGSAGVSNAGFFGNAASGSGTVDNSKTANVGASGVGSASTFGEAGNAAFGSAAGDGTVQGSNNFYKDTGQGNFAGGAFNTQATGSAAVGSNNKTTINGYKPDDGSALSLNGSAQATTANYGGIVQGGKNDTALTQSDGWLNIANDAQVNVAKLDAGVTNLGISNGSGNAHATANGFLPARATSGDATFKTGSIGSDAVSIGKDARGVFALAGNTGVGMSQTAIVHINSDIVGSRNASVGGGY